MRVLFGAGKIKKIRHCILTLGVYDGLHRGHLKILNKLVRYAKQINGKSAVVTFYPHPQSELNIYSLEHRLRLLKEIGIDICMVISFTDSFSQISASQFIKDFLIKKIRPDYIFIGENFSFGKDARGNPQLLKKYACLYDFKVRIFPVYKLKGKVVSSTYIRWLILEGRLKEARQLLGRRVSILGTVVKGSRLARYLGFPTANIKAHHEVLPPAGVYIASIIFHNKKLKGICYIGKKPTLGNFKTEERETIHIEVHIFGFNKNIYGKELEIQFIKKIREERRFASVELLARQVRKDIRIARSLLTP